jgi:hypothetical protein
MTSISGVRRNASAHTLPQPRRTSAKMDRSNAAATSMAGCDGCTGTRIIWIPSRGPTGHSRPPIRKCAGLPIDRSNRHPARRNGAFFFARAVLGAAEFPPLSAVNRPFPIAQHSPFIFNRLNIGERVSYQCFWGATLLRYQSPVPFCLTGPVPAATLSQTFQRELALRTSRVGNADWRRACWTPVPTPRARSLGAESRVSPVERLRLLTAVSKAASLESGFGLRRFTSGCAQ